MHHWSVATALTDQHVRSGASVVIGVAVVQSSQSLLRFASAVWWWSFTFAVASSGTRQKGVSPHM